MSQKKKGFFASLEEKVQGVAAQLNPFDNGRTYNTVRQQGASYAPQAPASVFHQATHSAPVRLATGFVAPATNLVRTSVINPIRLTAAEFSHNPVAYHNAFDAQTNAFHSLGLEAQGIARTLPETTTTLAHPFSQFTYHPGSRIEKTLFGSTPVQNIQKKVVNNYQTHSDLPGLLRYPLAGLEGAGSVVQDAPVAAGALKLGSKGVKASLPAAKSTATASKQAIKAVDDRAAALQAKSDDIWNQHNTNVYKYGKLANTAKNSAERKTFLAAANEAARLREARFQEIKQNQGIGRLGLSTRNVSPAGDNASPIPNLPQKGTNTNVPKASSNKSVAPNVPEVPKINLSESKGVKMVPIDKLEHGNLLGDYRYDGYIVKKDLVDQYKKDILAGKPIKPLTVKDGAIFDGMHRGTALKELGYKELPVKLEGKGNSHLASYPDFTQPTQGAVGKNVGATVGSQTIDLTPPDFLKPIKTASAKQSSKAGSIRLSSLSPEEQLKLPTTKRLGRSGPGSRQNHAKASGIPSLDANYTTNSTKIEIPTVAPGDYARARVNAQLASQPIEYAAGQVARTARSSKLTTSKLGQLVEGTDKAVTPAEKEAVRRYRILADRIHATSQALGGDTPYRKDYFHHEWDLSDPKKAAKFEQFRQRKFGKDYNPSEFGGLDTQPRVFDTVAQGEAAGFKLKNDNAANEILDYAKRSAAALKRQALAKGFMEADINQEIKPFTSDLGGGKTIALSEKGRHEFRAFEPAKQAGKPLKLYRGTNRKLKQTLLSASEFHPINITKKVTPALTLKGHPIRAAEGAYGAFRAQVGRKYSDALQQRAFEDGTVDFGARVGSPIKFGTDYSAEGKINLGHAGFGEKTIFEKSMPALHYRALQALRSDLDKRNIPYDSPEALAAGTRINEMMGFINTEVRNLDKGHQRFLSDVALAPQFTRAKWATIKSALKDTGLAGSYARRAVIGDTLATAAVMLGLGYLAKQKSDNIKDLLIRALVHPSVPTPFKDARGNTIELGMPSTYTSEALGLVANINRNPDGHLGVTFSPSAAPSNLADYGRARLAIIPNTGLKVATNTNFANKPLYDPNAPAGTQVQQAATTLVTGSLPIGLQGVAQTDAVKKHFGQGVQDVLTANTPGSNPVIKSIGSSFGLTPRTDKTVGKGQQTAQYFSALDEAKRGLNRQEQDALDLYTGGKKNLVTGKYEINPSVYDASAKAKVLLQNPKVIDNLIGMNQKLSSQGQNVDPLWQQPKPNIVKYLQYQTMAPGSADKTDWYNKNQSWYSPLTDQRNAFFSSLPPGDPNKPKLSLQYPEAPPAVQSLIDQYGQLTDSAQKGQFLDRHPEVIKQWNAVSDYNNRLRQELGYTPLKNYPEATPQLQAFMDKYSGSDKATRKAIRNGNPSQYQKMIAYFDSLDLYNINKQGAVSQLQGEPDYTSKQAKAISSLAQDIYQNPDGTYSIVPAGWMNGLSNGSGFGGGGGGGGKFKSKSTSGKTFRVKSAGSNKPSASLKKPSIHVASYKRGSIKLTAKHIPKAKGF